MRQFLLVFALFFSSLQAFSLEELPVAYKGRFRPLKSCASMEGQTPSDFWEAHYQELKLLPSRHRKGEWFPLQTLNVAQDNFTPYPDSLFEEIQKTYFALRKDKELRQKLANLLNEGYTQLAGTPIIRTSSKTLYYPKKWQLKLERLYFQYPFLSLCLGGYFLAFILFLAKRRAFPLFLATFALHTAILLARCLILQRPPVSNMAETILFVPWVAAAVALFFRSSFMLAAGAFSAFVLLALLHATEMENVQPVLDSRMWLTIHVLMVVGSYGAFVLSGVLAHLYLIKSSPCMNLAKAILRTLYLGVFLLISGTILGGVWAAQSWGRFWDWDPKESWAFISSCLYLIWIHAYTFGKIKERGLAVGAIIGLQAITFTWYGVNYILGTGLHSYGFGNGGEFYYFGFIGFELIFLALTSFRARVLTPS